MFLLPSSATCGEDSSLSVLSVVARHAWSFSADWQKPRYANKWQVGGHASKTVLVHLSVPTYYISSRLVKAPHLTARW